MRRRIPLRATARRNREREAKSEERKRKCGFGIFAFRFSLRSPGTRHRSLKADFDATGSGVHRTVPAGRPVARQRQPSPASGSPSPRRRYRRPPAAARRPPAAVAAGSSPSPAGSSPSPPAVARPSRQKVAMGGQNAVSNFRDASTVRFPNECGRPLEEGVKVTGKRCEGAEVSRCPGRGSESRHLDTLTPSRSFGIERAGSSVRPPGRRRRAPAGRANPPPVARIR